MNLTTVLLILVSVCLSATAQILLKLGMSGRLVQQTMNEGGLSAFMAVAGSARIWCGLLIYGLSVFLWLGVLSKIDVGQAYPFVSIGFVLTMLMGIFLLGEPFSVTRMTGTLLIMAGVVLVARSS